MRNRKIDKSHFGRSSDKVLHQIFLKKSQNIMLLYAQFLHLIAYYWIKVRLFYMRFSCSWLFSAINYFFKGDKYFDLVIIINEEKNMFRYDKSLSNIEYVEQNIKNKTQNLPANQSVTRVLARSSPLPFNSIFPIVGLLNKIFWN